jgi:chromate transporter
MLSRDAFWGCVLGSTGAQALCYKCAPMSDTPSDSTSSDPAPAPISTISPAELFFAFAKISVTGFGMILPWARRMIVDEKKWMTAEEFNETFSLSQFLPGPNVVNLSVVFGQRIAGAWGSIAALGGLLGPPATIAAFLSFLYSQFGDATILRGILAGIAAAAIGLMSATIAKMAKPVLLKLLSPAPIILAATFVAVGVLRLPLVPCLLVLAPVSVALAYWWPRR